jgi:hypothetical protein
MNRRCGECTLCCKLLPVGEIDKPGSTLCKFQRSSGCRIHSKPNYPHSCRVWFCGWMQDDQMSLPRPDRAHYVIDTSPDFATINGANVPVISIWIDEHHPHAWRNQALFDWLLARWRTRGQLAVARSSAREATILIPPNLHAPWWPTELVADEWREVLGVTHVREHTPAEIFEALKLRRICTRIL